MELAAYLQILNRRKWIIILTLVATMVAYFFIQPLIPTTYEATAILRITPYTSSNPSYNTIIYADRIMNNYVKIASSSLLMNELRERLGLTPNQPKDIMVDIIPDSEMLLITVEDYDPFVARDAANMLAELLSNIMINRDIRISIVDPATLPKPPSTLMVILRPVFLVILGFIGGTVLAFIFENLDTRVFTIEQIKMITELPILGEIPTSRVKFPVNSPFLDDSIKRLRTKVLIESRNNPLQTLLITSAEPKEGKSTIVTHLGYSMSLTGRKCIIVDADLYCPTIHKLFDLPNDVGLSSVLENIHVLSDALCETQYPDLFVLTSGPSVSNPTELLGSEQTIILLDELKKDFDMVLLDSPAFLGAADTAVLASTVDGVILVARRGSVKIAPLQATYKQLDGVHAKIVGVVVNRVKKHLPSSYHKYYRPSMLVQTKAKASAHSSDITRSSQPMREDVDSLDTDRVETLIPSVSNDNEMPQVEMLVKDDLTEIKGIGPAHEKALNAIGISTFAQLAEQDAVDLANRIGGRITAQNICSNQWIDQARAFCVVTDDHPVE